MCFSLSPHVLCSLTFLLLLLHCHSQPHLVWDHPRFLSNTHKGLCSAELLWEGWSVAELPTFDMLQLSLKKGEAHILHCILCCRTRQFPQSAIITEYIQQVACSKFPTLKRWVPKKYIADESRLVSPSNSDSSLLVSCFPSSATELWGEKSDYQINCSDSSSFLKALFLKGLWSFLCFIAGRERASRRNGVRNRLLLVPEQVILPTAYSREPQTK